MTYAVVKSYFYVAQSYDIEGITRISLDLVLVLEFLLGCEKKKRGNPL